MDHSARGDAQATGVHPHDWALSEAGHVAARAAASGGAVRGDALVCSSPERMANFAEGARRVFGDESKDEATARFRGTLRTALATTRGDVAVVSHERIIASYLGSISGASGYARWQQLTMPCLITITSPDASPQIVGA